MFFLGLCLALTALAFVLQLLFGDWRDVRGAFRYGLAGGFLFTGLDHFVHFAHEGSDRARLAG